MNACHEKDKQAWVDNFADDALIEDPIGRSPLDPEGKGHRGKEAISRFWDNQIAPNRILHITEGVAEFAARPFVLK